MNPKMLKTIGFAFAALMLLTPGFSYAHGKETAAKLTPKAVELRLVLRNLWQGHIFWVRNVVLATKLGEKDVAKVAEEQAVENAKEIANSVVPFYGKEAGDKLFNLLAGHYGAVKDCMNAMFTGNKKAEEASIDKMKSNAEAIAAFLNSANPKNWPKETLVSALMAHAGFHMAQIQQINAKNFSAEAKTWEGMKNQINQVADFLADGIIK